MPIIERAQFRHAHACRISDTHFSVRSGCRLVQGDSIGGANAFLVDILQILS
jgi:hypothetical protein